MGNEQRAALPGRGSARQAPHGVSERWRSVAGCGLSSLAPHDVHAATSFLTSIMPR